MLLSIAGGSDLGPVSYTHLDVYKRQPLAQVDAAAISRRIVTLPLSLIHI